MNEQLETARKEFNNWQGRAAIFVDFSDGSFWCLVGDIPSYHSDTVIKVVFKDDLHSRNDRYGEERLSALVSAMKKKYDQGWRRDDFIDYGDYEFAEYYW